MDPTSPHDMALRVAVHYQRRLAVTSLVVLVIVLLGLVAVVWEMLATVRALVPILTDFGCELGDLTRLMLAPGAVGWVAILSAVWVGLIVKEALRMPAWVKLMVNLVVGLLAVVLLEVFRYAMYSPVFQMFESLQQ